MTFDTPRSPNVDRFSVAASLIDCLSYALRVDDAGRPQLIWHAGSMQSLTTPPLMLHFIGGGGAKIADPDVGTVDGHWRRLSSGNKSEVEFRIILADRSTRWVRDTATPIHDRQGEVQEVIGSVQDVTKNRGTGVTGPDESLVLQAFQQLDIGLALWDGEDQLTVWNLKFEDLFLPVAGYLEPGLSYDRFLDLAAKTGHLIPGEKPQAWSAERKSTHEKGGSAELVLPDGRCFDLTVQEIGAAGCATIVSDVSAQKRGELALRNAKEMAEAADATKSRFLRAANHDLRQPLATLKILIYSCMTEEDENHRRDLLHAMDISAGIMEDILSVLLQVGQLDAGKITPRLTNFQLSPFLDRLRTQYEHQAREKGVELRIVPTRSTIVSDRALLERIVSNFIANACRYTASGKIVIGCRKSGGNVRLEVHDTGCGIPADQLDAIFQEFYQVPGGANATKRGLGLGLNIAARIADLLDHDLHVRSRPGHGSVFAIDLPQGDVWKSEVGEPEITEAVGGQFVGTRAIILEDDEILRQTLVDLLSRWGVDTRPAANGEDIEEIFATDDWKPDFMLADYRLRGGARGTEIANKLRQTLKIDLPCIVMTADTEPDLIDRIKAERFPLMIKPINPPQLRVIMHNLLFEPERLAEERG